MQEEGLSVFLQGLENRGPQNARKRIYMSALTPDLYRDHYGAKVRAFLDELFAAENEGGPLMQHYYDGYFDMYWDLHLGVRGDDIPEEVREIGEAFNTVIGFWDPRREAVHASYMRVRELRPGLREWIDARLDDVIEGRVEAPEATFVHYWAVNGGLGENFRREDVIFECFHNFLAFSQWGNTLYRLMGVLAEDAGDPAPREWLARTMEDPDTADESGFTALDRYVMELFRTISPNTGSVSTVASTQEGVTGRSFVIHPHPETSRAERHWQAPDAFDPDRYGAVATAAEIGEERCAAIGFARCPFSQASMGVRDGRAVELPSNGFGTVHATVEGVPVPLVDHAGYAPFGFGYRRCAGEWLTVEVFKDVVRRIHGEGLVFRRLDLDAPERLPVGPVVAIEDDIGFGRG
jgi:cytochrome P450